MTTVSPAFEHLMGTDDYDDSGPADDGDGYRMTNAIPSADSDGVAANLPGDASTSSTPAPLTRIQKRKLRYKLYRADKRRKEREMKLAENAMSGGPLPDSDPNRMTNDGPGVDSESAAACLSSHASTDPSSIVTSSIPPNTGMKRRLSSSSPRAAKRQKEAAKSATFDGPVTDSGPNHTTSDAPGSDRDSAATHLSTHISTLPSSTSSMLEVAENTMLGGPLTSSNSDPNHMIIDTSGTGNDGTAADPSSRAPKRKSLARIQKDRIRSKIRRGAKRYKEKQMRLAKEAMAGSPLTESNQSDPHCMTNDAPGTDSGRADPCLAGDASIPPILRRKSDALHIAGLHGAGLNNDG